MISGNWNNLKMYMAKRKKCWCVWLLNYGECWIECWMIFGWFLLSLIFLVSMCIHPTPNPFSPPRISNINSFMIYLPWWRIRDVILLNVIHTFTIDCNENYFCSNLKINDWEKFWKYFVLRSMQPFVCLQCILKLLFSKSTSFQKLY